MKKIAITICSLFLLSTDNVIAQGRKKDKKYSPKHSRLTGGRKASISRERPSRATQRISRPSPKISKPERVERPSRIMRGQPEKPERVERPGRPERPERVERPERAERPSRAVRKRLEKRKPIDKARPIAKDRRKAQVKKKERIKPDKQDKSKKAKRAKQKKPKRTQTGEPKPLTQKQKKEVLSQPAVKKINRFAQTQTRKNPQLKSEIQTAKQRWETNTRVRRRWYSDWNTYSWYHSHSYFYPDSFINFTFFAPWFIFPYTFYPRFFTRYPIAWLQRGWLRYPAYWQYGFAVSINFTDYVYEERYDDLIVRLEERITYLEDKVEKLEKQEYQKQLSEVLWLLDDLKRTIKKQSKLSRREKKNLLNRIEEIKDKAPEIQS